MATDLTDAIARKNAKQPQRTDLWGVRLPSLQEGLSKGQGFSAMEKASRDIAPIISEGIAGTPKFDMKDINHRISSINIPLFNITVEQAIENNTYWHYPTRHEISEVTMDIDEFEDSMTMQYLNTWQSIMVRDDGTYYPPAIYKLPITVYRLASTKKAVVIKHIYEGCFLSAVTEVASDYESTEILTYNVTFTADSVETEIMDVSDHISQQEEKIIQQRRIHFAGDDPANIRDFMGGQPVDDAYDVFNNVVERVPNF